MIRVNIIFDRETLRLADQEARRRKVSRSEVIRSALRKEAANRKRDSEGEARRKQQREAVETMERLAREFGDWPAEKILRLSRDRWASQRR